jgi:hypothetical protein
MSSGSIMNILSGGARPKELGRADSGRDWILAIGCAFSAALLADDGLLAEDGLLVDDGLVAEDGPLADDGLAADDGRLADDGGAPISAVKILFVSATSETMARVWPPSRRQSNAATSPAPSAEFSWSRRHPTRQREHIKTIQ